MLNNDYLKGYVAALENIKSALSSYQTAEPSEFVSYDLVNRYIDQTKENYKKLVKDLNESQSKKTT